MEATFLFFLRLLKHRDVTKSSDMSGHGFLNSDTCINKTALAVPLNSIMRTQRAKYYCCLSSWCPNARAFKKKKNHTRKQVVDFKGTLLVQVTSVGISSQQKIAPKELDKVPKLLQSLFVLLMRRKKHQPEEYRRHLNEDFTRNPSVWGY